MNDRLVWIDCEMTGLDLEKDALIEVAALVTDFELNVLGEGVDLVVKPPAEAISLDAAKKTYEKYPVDTSTLAGRIKHITDACFGGRRIVDWLAGDQLPRIC